MTVSVVVVDSGLSDLRGPELAWYVEDAAVHQGGVAPPGPPDRHL